MSLTELEDKIIAWGYDKGILPNPDPMAQLTKTFEEVDELSQAITDDDTKEIKDAIGDIFVTLVMQAQAWGVTVEDCAEQAYNVISKRTGKMVNGVFVKDE